MVLGMVASLAQADLAALRESGRPGACAVAVYLDGHLYRIFNAGTLSRLNC